MSKKRRRPKKGRWKHFNWEQGGSSQILTAWTLLFGNRNFEEALVFLQNNNFIDVRGRYYHDRLTEEQQSAWEIFFGQPILPPYTPTKHHTKPRSRGGGNSEENILDKIEFVHQAWHNLFSNKLLDEIVKYLKDCQRHDWQAIRLNPKKFRSWLVVFGNKFFLKKIIAIIKKDWFKNSE